MYITKETKLQLSCRRHDNSYATGPVFPDFILPALLTVASAIHRVVRLRNMLKIHRQASFARLLLFHPWISVHILPFPMRMPGSFYIGYSDSHICSAWPRHTWRKHARAQYRISFSVAAIRDPDGAYLKLKQSNSMALRESFSSRVSIRKMTVSWGNILWYFMTSCVHH